MGERAAWGAAGLGIGLAVGLVVGYAVFHERPRERATAFVDALDARAEAATARRAARGRLDFLAMRYETWAGEHPGEACPRRINDLAPGAEELFGGEIRIACGESAPDGIGFGAVWSGPDRTFGTDDDLRSWE